MYSNDVKHDRCVMSFHARNSRCTATPAAAEASNAGDEPHAIDFKTRERRQASYRAIHAMYKVTAMLDRMPARPAMRRPADAVAPWTAKPGA